tara:strand:- start:3185 stop:3979 length:795 start_codon:yes stop_codon:yes gene_type:complete
MIKIQRKLKINKYVPVDYPVYSQDEADKQGLPYIHWKDCEPGDWGISDDGYVAICITRNSYKKGTEMTFPYGKQWITSSSKLEFLKHHATGNYVGVTTKSHMDKELKTRRSQDMVNAYLIYIMAGRTPDWDKLGQIYRPDQKKPAVTVKRLLKTKGMKQMIEEKMKEILTDRGIDEGFVLDVIKDAIEVAKVKEDSGNMIRAAKELGDFLDMKPKSKSTTESLEMDITHQIGEQFETQKKQLKATKTQPVDEDNGKDYKDIGKK